jgi:lactoylglutathione lyase/glyoxylase I family protein
VHVCAQRSRRAIRLDRVRAKVGSPRASLPATDDTFFVEILGDGKPHPIPKLVYDDLGDSLRLAGCHHFCLQVASVDDTLAELRRRGVTIVTEPLELPAINRRLAFLADPWGNRIELAQVLP